MLPANLTFVDLETSGSSATADRIIEIGILRVENGKLVRKFQSLVNPQTHVSSFIEEMTGITAKDVEKAPTFRQIQDEIVDMLADSVFVAHNARFDYGFLKNELKRNGVNFSLKHFCTVKLFRALHPELPHHNLDSLIKHFDLKCKNRHRAYDDAKVLWDFYKASLDRYPHELLEQAINLAMRKPTIPIGLNPSFLDKLPENPGVYVFYDQQGLALYVGKSINVRDRVLSHFSADYSSNTEMKIAQQIHSLETFTASSELEALIMESQMIKKIQPVYNRKLRNRHDLVLIKKHRVGDYDSAIIDTAGHIDPNDIQEVLAICSSAKQAKQILQELVQSHRLCPKLLGLEKARSGCFYQQLGKCNGACKGLEPAPIYNVRFLTAFSRHAIKHWPFAGPIVIQKKYLIDKWCILNDDQEYYFDVDTYKILASFISQAKNQKHIKLVSNVGSQAESPFLYDQPDF